MTARLLPAEPGYANVSERRFAERLLEQLPQEVVVYANQRFTDRSGDREADLIVLWPGYGIAVIEIKGGLIHLVDGQWRQPWSSDPRGWKRIDPALRDYLHQHPRWSHGSPRLVHMVALPAADLGADFFKPDAPRWLIMDRNDTPHAAERIGQALRAVEGQPPPPTNADVARLVDCITGTAVPQRDLLTRLREREDTCELLTEDQARVLDMVSSHPRVEIRGGAGSGKTWLAVEKARRLSAGRQAGGADVLLAGTGRVPQPPGGRACTRAAARVRRNLPLARYGVGRTSRLRRRLRLLGDRPARDDALAGTESPVRRALRRHRDRRGTGFRRKLVACRTRGSPRPGNR
ncbi:MAG: NERD domain-containing protein/DEAD/DEAH box helicase [Geodermatophilaceae bacterium]